VSGGEKKNEKPFTNDRSTAANKAELLPKVDRRIALMHAHGILANPAVVIEEAHAEGVPLELACALLMQETGGGRNEWGHDPTIFVGGYDAHRGVHYGETVTEDAYKAYLAQRGKTGRGGMQGVGPVQLTYYSYQDEADAEGGCWQSRFNMRIGFRHLAANVKRYGLRAGVAAYNGSGPAAQRYANSVLALAEQWKHILA
jgi:hypothetical protein